MCHAQEASAHYCKKACKTARCLQLQQQSRFASSCGKLPLLPLPDRTGDGNLPCFQQNRQGSSHVWRLWGWGCVVYLKGKPEVVVVYIPDKMFPYVVDIGSFSHSLNMRLFVAWPASAEDASGILQLPNKPSLSINNLDGGMMLAMSAFSAVLKPLEQEWLSGMAMIWPSITWESVRQILAIGQEFCTLSCFC